MTRAVFGVVCVLVVFGNACAIRLPIGISGSILPRAERHGEKLNLRPLIGILSEVLLEELMCRSGRHAQAAGARAVPIQCDLPPHELERRFRQVNGVLIPGGGQNLSRGHKYYDATARLLRLAQDANDAGDFFPVHATCLGFEAVSLAVSGNDTLLGSFDGEDNPSRLRLLRGGGVSRFWRSLPRSVRRDVLEHKYTMENHSGGVSAAAFEADRHLRNFFRAITTSEDRAGNVFVSTMEAKQYPFTATQWHPEKNAFEWNSRMHIPHQPGAVDVTLAVAKQFVAQARRNFHAPADPLELDELLIYNWPVAFTGKHDPSGKGEGYFDECYFFPPEDQRPRLQFEAAAVA